MSDRHIVLITGANTGIGYEAAKALLESGRSYCILLGCRSLEKAQYAIERLGQEVPSTRSVLDAVQVDIASDESIEGAFEHVSASHGRLDALVNNAGASFDWELKAGQISLRESWNKAFEVNVRADPRLLFLTSGLSSLQRTSNKLLSAGDLTPPAAGWPKEDLPAFDTMAYRSRKTALNMTMLNWAWRLANDGVKTWCVSPGFLATNLGNSADLLKQRGAGDPSIGGRFVRDVVEGQRDADVGKVVFNDGTVQPF
ncbi:hypothetical protein PG997_000185 [Apiospora hydei]|uniref:Uncharacterized protein n=1 Tax=Apiospora hydei TaxID=1337664 RepID=A0ABR1X9W5_9PEZI